MSHCAIDIKYNTIIQFIYRIFVDIDMGFGISVLHEIIDIWLVRRLSGVRMISLPIIQMGFTKIINWKIKKMKNLIRKIRKHFKMGIYAVVCFRISSKNWANTAAK